MFEGALGSRYSAPKIEVPYRFNVGDIIDYRYFVRGHIGQGGMGHVLRVQDQVTRQLVLALKYCAEVRFGKRFACEVRIMESVDSPYVIRILDSNLESDPPYFIMPLGERSLESDLPRIRGSEDQILDIFGQICLGVKDLHERNILHRDLKPANVLKLADGLVVVSDLGLARLEDHDTTTLTTVVGRLGTEDYLAPEQLQQGDAGKTNSRTDIYQLGKVLCSRAIAAMIGSAIPIVCPVRSRSPAILPASSAAGASKDRTSSLATAFKNRCMRTVACAC